MARWKPRGASSNTQRVGRHYPISLFHWDDFIPNAHLFNIHNFQAGPGWREGKINDKLEIKLEANASELLRSNVFSYFSDNSLGSIGVPPRTSSETETANALSNVMFGDADFAGLGRGGEVCGVIEVKTPSGVDQMNDKDLASLFGERNNIHRNSARAIAQIVGYMLDNGCQYGVLTTYNETRFLRAMDRDNFQITEVVLADAETVPGQSVTLRRAFGYWLFLCTNSLFFRFERPKRDHRRQSIAWRGGDKGHSYRQ